MSAKVPNIVAAQDFTGLSAALTKTTVFTPSADGTFRVSAGIDVPAAGSVTAAVDWYDEHR